MEKPSVNILLPIWECFIVFSLSVISFSTHAQNYTVADSLKANRLMKAANDSTEIAPERSLQLVDEGLVIARKIGYPKAIANGLQAKALAYVQLGDVKNAYSSFENAMAVATKYNLVRIKRNLFYSLANMYSNMGNYPQAIENYQQAIKLAEEAKDTISMAKIYNALAGVYATMKYYDQADRFAFYAVELCKAVNDSDQAAFIYSNIASSYFERKKYDDGFEILSKSIHLYTSLHDTISLAYCDMNMGDYYKDKNRADSALYFYTRALPVFNKIQAKDAIAATLDNIGTVYYANKQFDEAEKYFKESLELTIQTADRYHKYRAEYYLSMVYKQKNDFKKAFQYLAESQTDNDSLINAEKASKITALTAKYDVMELEQKNTTLQNENSVQRLTLQRKNILVAGTIGVLFAMLVIGILLFRQSKLKSNQQKTELEQKQLRAQMNPHFIFNCLNSIQHFIVANDVKNANKYLSGFALLMRQTLENSKAEVITLRKEIEYLENYLALERMRFEDKFTSEIICDDTVNIDRIEIPAMIIQPFIENAIRHGLCYLDERPGKLKMSFFIKGNCLYCVVDDNGIGREQSHKLKMGLDRVYESQGMELTRQRLALVSKSVGAEYKIEITDRKNKEGQPEGTTITIKFPIDS